MTFPFHLAHEYSLDAATLIGVAFGFVLERAGFGRATKLAAQFYLRDMTVFKVMFTAIVTAMLGLVAASSLGFADLRGLSESIASWTYVWPMLAGGFVLGAGFIISGYCPGTSVVAAASGNVDGMVAVGGVIAGTYAYTQLLGIPSLARFHDSGEREAWFLYDWLPLKPATIAIAIAVMAVLAFIGAEMVERVRPRTWRLAIPAFAVLALLVVMPWPRATGGGAVKESAIDASALAPHYIREPWRYQIAEGKVTDLATGRTSTLRGQLHVGTTAVKTAPAASRPVAPFAKPKKKGGGCSS